MARQRGWRIVMRIEDLDGPRIKPGAAEQALDILRWLGIDWDEGPHVQSEDLSAYVAAMRTLAGRGLAYPSELTRKEIEEAASAPQSDAPMGEGGGHEVRFPPELRPALVARGFDDPSTNWRFATPAETVEFEDRFAGAQRRRPADSIGDFVIWTRRGQPSYQLAVVVDDARQGITHVVRGDDLLDSAARQLLLYRALALANEPRYAHLPLVIGEDGRRLAKRHGDTRLSLYRDLKVRPERVVGLLARWCGIADETEMTAKEFAARLDVDRMPREAVVFRAEDDLWLRSRT
jgi:glutamyl-tRNA synthetase